MNGRAMIAAGVGLVQVLAVPEPACAAPGGLARFRDDALPYWPRLVIWQAGGNAVLRRADRPLD